MWYRCATNPSIHHHRRHVATMSLPLSHHGVAFMSVVVLLLPSRCHLRHHIVVVSLSQSYHCGAFTVASSQFCRHCHSVTFVVALSRFCRHRGVAFIVTLSWCHRHSF